MARCHSHTDEPAVAACRDCGRSTCDPCRVQVRRLGDLCSHCALVRAGLRPKSARP